MKSHYALLTLLTVIFSVNLTWSQNHTCGFEEYFDTYANEKSFIDAHSLISTLSRSTSEVDNTTIYTLPVVVHIMHRGEAVGTGPNISDAQVISAINHLNVAFRGNNGLSTDTRIQFQLAKLDPNCNITNGITRTDARSVSRFSDEGVVIRSNDIEMKRGTIWDHQKYYNIWVVPEINNNNGGYGVMGFATFPGSSSDRDGAVVQYNAFGHDPQNTQFNLLPGLRLNSTLVHEMGHGMGLYHTFEGDKGTDGKQDTMCPPANKCTHYDYTARRWVYEGDCCGDTPEHVRSSNCSEGINRCTNTPLIDHKKNYMDYSGSTCQSYISPDQTSRMREMILAYRSILLDGYTLTSEQPPATADIKPASCTVSAPVNSGDYAGIDKIEFGSLKTNNGYPASDGPEYDKTNDCLYKTIFDNNATQVPLSVTVLGPNRTYVKAWIDYNNNGSFDNDELVMEASVARNATNKTVTTTVTPPQDVVENTSLRLRVMCDLNNNFGPCGSLARSAPAGQLQYGQAEDYSISFNGPSPAIIEEFSATDKGSSVLLEWSTSSETDTDRYTVQRSEDGRSYKDIHATRAADNQEGASYSYEDQEPVYGKSYYRIQLTDINGDNHILGTPQYVYRYAPQSFAVYPNPVADNEVNIDYPSPKEGSVAIDVMDVSGKKIFAYDRKAKVGSNTFTILIPSTKAGVYLIQVTGAQTRHHQMIIKE